MAQVRRGEGGGGGGAENERVGTSINSLAVSYSKKLGLSRLVAALRALALLV